MVTQRKGGTAPSRPTKLLIATRKGLWTIESDAARRAWKLAGPQFLGHIVHHAVLDPRDRKTLLAAVRTGHLGPTIFRSIDRGRTWKEAVRPPAFHPGSGRTVDHSFWLAAGHASEPGVWYAGTSPQGLFRSEDGGATWSGVDGFNEHPQRQAWCGGDKDGTPDGPKLHSILVDPRDSRHLYIGMSSGGVFESTDGGADWRPLNRGVKALFCRTPIRSSGTIRIACGCIRGIPTGSTTRITAGSIGWIVRGTVGSISVRRCRNPSVRSVSRLYCIRGIRRPCGCFRWTARTSGPGSRLPGSRRRIARSMAARPGSGRRPACRRRRPGGPSNDRQ